MPAEGRQNAAGLTKGDRILVVRDKAGKLQPSKGKTLALVATVENRTGAKPAGRTRYTIHTDLGPVEDLAPIQTFWLATEKQKLKTEKAPVPAAHFSAPEIPVQTKRPSKAFQEPEVPVEERCRHRSGCQERAAVRVVDKPWQYCTRHGAEFELSQEAVVHGRFELEPVR